jgi:hypothetical protein
MDANIHFQLRNISETFYCNNEKKLALKSDEHLSYTAAE